MGAWTQVLRMKLMGVCSWWDIMVESLRDLGFNPSRGLGPITVIIEKTRSFS